MRKNKDLLTDDDMKPENVRIRISMMVPGDLLDMYRLEAEKLGIGYQTLMQLKLREAIISGPLEKRIQAIEKKIKRA